jgi:V8-like Glu-specific endopeptidase
MIHAPRVAVLTASTLCALAFPYAARAQDPLPSVRFELGLDSGWHENQSNSAQIVLSLPVTVEGAAWMRLEFGDVVLAGSDFAGDGSLLRITSLYDGAVQEMRAVHVEQWRSTSAYFNGGDLLVEVLAEPGTGPNRVVVAAVTTDLSGTPESICGPTDDRVLSNDNRSARLVPIGCTGWLIDDCNTCALTAGHCTGGSMQVMQFNVPLSTSSGAIQNPPPSDQYAIDVGNVQTNGGQGVGNDWGYFGVFANSTTGLTPFQAYGVRHTLSAPPAFNAAHMIRITGYGTRSSPPEWNQVQETHAGPWVTSSGTTQQYQADTTGGNSGSPVIHDLTGTAIGIHTHGGCVSTNPVGQNSGTGSNHAGLQAALAAPVGVCATGFSIVGSLPTSMSIGSPAPVTIQAGPAIVPGSPTLHYRYQGGAFTALAMTAGANSQYSASLPAPNCGDAPQFYISAINGNCGSVTHPLGAPASFHSATLTGGIEVTLLNETFQTNQGWTTSIAGATSGQWERGTPVNDPNWAYDPTSDGDGSGQCWLTQNQIGNTDVDGGSVTLTSPALDMSGGSVLLRYLYYLNLTNTDGSDRLLVEMSSNGLAGPWVVVATHTTNGALTWRSHEVTVAQILAAGLTYTSDVRLRFTANDSGSASIVEAGVDGFRVVRAACAPFVNYCVSGALGSVISATGSSSIAANDLVLHASNIPADKNGLFFYSTNKLQAPFGNGTRCVGSPAARLPLVNSGAGTTLDFALNYGALSTAIQAGDLWNFQCWFRDGSLYDLSDGLQVVFLP